MSHRRHLSSPRYWDINFDQGAATSVLDTGSVRITPRNDWDSNWCWHAMRSDRLGGKIPHFLIAKASRFAAPAANENLAVWSIAPDTDIWYQFDNQAVGASDIEFYNNAPFPNSPIYISFWPLFPFSRVERLYREWIKDARVTKLAVGQATRRASAMGRTAPGLPFYGLMITNSNANTKNHMILSAYNHPSEVTGAYQLEGAMAWLLGGGVEAEFILDWFEVFVYPCLNPQGVVGGYFRSCPQDTTRDHNREWDDTGVLECIDAFKTSMNAETGGAIEVGIDFHSSIGATDGYMSSDDHTAALYAVWLAKMVAYDAGFSYSDAILAGSLRTLWTGTYSAKLGISCEYGSLNTKSLTNWKTQGQYALRSIAAMHAEGRWTNGPGVGSRELNGTTDRIDWSAVYDLTGSPLTVSAWVNFDAVAHNSYILEIHQTGDANIGIQFYATSANTFGLQRGTGATSLYRLMSSAGDFTGGLHHFLVTHDGTVNDYTTIHIYFDGIALTTESIHQNGSSIPNPIGSWSVGGRIYDDTRNVDGKLSQVAVWNRVVTLTEIANLAAGYAPDLAAASGLQFYFKANTSSLVAVPGGTGTADGTSQLTGVGNGPAIIYG